MDELLEHWSFEDTSSREDEEEFSAAGEVVEEPSNIENKNDERNILDDTERFERRFSDASIEQNSLEMNPFDGLPYSSIYYELLDRRKALPVWNAKDDFVLAVDESPVVLVTGRNGSGKSTQIPQWCAQFARESDFQFGSVVCSQPTALAAISLASQVAQEMDLTSVGTEVGYDVPHLNCTSDETILKFCTDDILLQEMGNDPMLQKYGFVLIDEVQERAISTDILLSLLKVVTTMREDLKLIVISHTYEMPTLEDFFEGVPIVDLHFLEDDISCEHIEKSVSISKEDEEKQRRERIENERMRQLDITYLPCDKESVSSEAVNLALRLHTNQDIKGDFIIFLSSRTEIENASEEIVRRSAIMSVRGECGEVQVVILHRDLAYGKQQAMYERFSGSTDEQKLLNRRIIVTDIVSESSFSVENIDVLIDSGLRQEIVYNCRIRTYSSSIEFISQDNTKARTEKCSLKGSVYRLYSKETYEKMDVRKSSPITRCELTSKILLIKRLLPRLNISFAQLQLIEPPDPESYMMALEELDYHGALDENGNLSDLGLVLSEFPLSISQAKTVISSCGEDCTQEILSIIAMLTSPSCFVYSNKQKSDATRCHERMEHQAGDHFTLLNIYQQFSRNGMSEFWCIKHYLNYDSLQMAAKNRKELLSIMESLELPISEPLSDHDLLENSVKKALLAGYFMQIAWNTDGCGNYHIIRDRHVARINSNSHSNRQPEWILFNDFELDENSFISTVSGITAKWIVEIVPRSYLLNLPHSESKDIILKTVECLRLYKSEETPKPLTSGDLNLGDQRRHHYKNHAVDYLQPNVPSSSSKAFDNSVHNNVVKTGNEAQDSDDTDVITLTVRDVTYAYNKASDYLNSDTSAQSQCRVQ